MLPVAGRGESSPSPRRRTGSQGPGHRTSCAPSPPPAMSRETPPETSEFRVYEAEIQVIRGTQWLQCEGAKAVSSVHVWQLCLVSTHPLRCWPAAAELHRCRGPAEPDTHSVAARSTRTRVTSLYCSIQAACSLPRRCPCSPCRWGRLSCLAG